MIRLLISGLVLVLGSATFWVLEPEILPPTPAPSTPQASVSPANPSQVLRPSNVPTEAPSPSQTASGASPVVPLPTVPQVTLEPSFIPIPTPTLPPLPPVPSPPALGKGCYQVEVTPNTPTGIAGCIRFGKGIASSYAGTGAAMNFCTWTYRMNHGCGSVRVTTAAGITIRLPVTDFCDCYTGTEDERIIDLPLSALPLLGLDPLQGLWRVTVER